MNTPDDWREEYSDEIIDDISIWERIDICEAKAISNLLKEYEDEVDKIACRGTD